MHKASWEHTAREESECLHTYVYTQNTHTHTHSWEYTMSEWVVDLET